MTLMRHNSRPRVAWDAIVIAAVGYSAIVLPYRLVAGERVVEPLYWLTTAILSFDIVLRFRTTIRLGLRLLDTPREVAVRYLRTWFVPDLIAAFPFVPFVLAFAGPAAAHDHYGLVAFLSLVRCLKILRVPGNFRGIQEAFEISPSVMRLVSFVFWFSLALHMLSLGWIAIGASEADRPFVDQYVRALYWVTTTVATIGYGDYYPSHDSNVQIIYTIFVQLAGVGTYGFIIGNIATLITHLDVSRAEYERKMEVITTFMVGLRIPPALQGRVRDYYQYVWTTRRTAGESPVMSELPPTLRTEIALFLNRGIIEKVDLLSGADEIFIREVVQLLQPMVFMPGDFVIRQGEYGDCMYFLSSGSVEVLADGKRVAELGAGSPFGETSLVQGEKRNASVRALTYCDAYRLTKADFDGLRAKYPEFDQKLRAIVAERSQAAADRKSAPPSS